MSVMDGSWHALHVDLLNVYLGQLAIGRRGEIYMRKC